MMEVANVLAWGVVWISAACVAVVVFAWAVAKSMGDLEVDE